MAFRFQKRIKILPGVTANLSKSGVSTSIGPKGVKATFGHGQQRMTVGIPGSGLSATAVSKKRKLQPEDQATTKKGIGFFKLLGYGLLALMMFMIIGSLTGLI